ncbi:protoglobin domain-containing protein [Hydrogenothermus marinus]|uniref:Phosphate-starvation-inducible protein E n=1 Tax=Hydrogenothermus marinus TaxID=133270 RepID=A0A3M0B9H4_9AQUI|nr:protoglobin domain-containing protein [Hydrogenothermus marinus]RMA93236.1 phosphate-starvation-inducible protein E [Hydrogenothermus marinus]
MESFDQIKKDFDFTPKDEERLKQLKPVMEKYLDEYINELYDFIFRLPKAKQYLKNEEIINRHKKKLKEWYLDLFSGVYDERYFEKLHKVGEVHDSLGVPTHYINASFNFTRRFFIRKINEEFGYSRERNLYVESVGKILDINLDVFTKSYIEEEISRYMEFSRLEKKLIKAAKRFKDFLDLALLVSLIFISFFVIGLLGFDVYKFVIGEVHFEEGIIATLGSLLILWAVVELMGEEIKHLKGGGFALTAFLGVALAAVIRKILIASLSPEDTKKLLAYGIILLIIGIVYYLLNKNVKKGD